MPIAADTYRPIPFGYMNPHAKLGRCGSGVPEILRFKVYYRESLFIWPGKVHGKLAGKVMER